jgi:hypothetical protein
MAAIQDLNIRVVGLDKLIDAIQRLGDQKLELHTEDPLPTELQDLMWLIQHGMHLMIGMKGDAPYIRLMPMDGIQPCSYEGTTLSRALGKARREVERQIGGVR